MLQKLICSLTFKQELIWILMRWWHDQVTDVKILRTVIYFYFFVTPIEWNFLNLDLTLKWRIKKKLCLLVCLQEINKTHFLAMLMELEMVMTVYFYFVFYFLFWFFNHYFILTAKTIICNLYLVFCEVYWLVRAGLSHVSFFIIARH